MALHENEVVDSKVTWHKAWGTEFCIQYPCWNGPKCPCAFPVCPFSAPSRPTGKKSHSHKKIQLKDSVHNSIFALDFYYNHQNSFASPHSPPPPQGKTDLSLMINTVLVTTFVVWSKNQTCIPSLTSTVFHVKQILCNIT